jgi:3-oxoacyl-[acyl-carrier protein] reductase
MTRSALFVGTSSELGDQLETAFSQAGFALERVDPAHASSEAEVHQQVAELDARAPIEILVWGALYPSGHGFMDVTLDGYQKYMRQAVHSAFFHVRACLRGMGKRRSGRLLLLTSLSAGVGDPDVLRGTASGVLNTFVKSVAREEARRGITVNGIAVGPVAGWPASETDVLRRFHEHYFPFKEPVDVVDLARTIVTLTTEPSGRVNGQIVRFDGGTL